jgi:CBS domain-containing protein
MTDLVARDIMNPEVLTVQDEMSVRELSSFLTSREISGATVEDSDGKLIGVVSLTDIALSASRSRSMPARDQSNPDFFVRGWEDSLEMSELAGFTIEDESLRVRQIMTAAVYEVDEAASVSEVAKTMLGGHLHRVLVTSGGKVVGIITTSDLLKLLA